jgi:hypothetical protein
MPMAPFIFQCVGFRFDQVSRPSSAHRPKEWVEAEQAKGGG